MDFFQKLFGYKEPTIVELPGDNWVELESTDDLHSAIARRARREKWETNGQAHEFHCLARVHGTFTAGQLEIDCLGTSIAFLTHEQSAGALERLRADNGLRITAIKARASVDEDGRWQVAVLV